MPKFRKEIVTAGTYKQWDRNKQQWYNREISPEYLQKLKASFDKMQAKGLRVPAPWKHDLSINAFAKVDGPNKEGGFLDDASVNGGFWEKLELQVVNGKTKLVGVIDAPGSKKDPNTPAGKISKTVKDTSIYVRDKVPMTDGSDEIIEDAIMHIALVTHPIEPGQKNFEALEDDASYLAMSQYIESDPKDSQESGDDTVGIGELSAALKKCCKLFLPDGTTSKNLVSNLLIAVKQYEMLNDESEESKEIVKVEPIIMNQQQIDALVQAKVTNPVTGKPFVNEDFKVQTPQVDNKTEIIMSALQTQMQEDRRNSFKSRIDNLVATGRTTKAFADSNLYPKASSYEIKIEGSKVATSNLEELLMSFESMEPVIKKVAAPEVIMGGAPVDDTTYTEEESDAAADYMASLI